MALAAEVERSNVSQNELHEDDPRAFCGQDVEYRGLKSVTGVQDIRSAQLYFGSAGPPENWVDIHRQDGSPYVLKEGEHIIKVGCHDHNTGRHGEHVREYKRFGVNDSILDENPSRFGESRTTYGTRTLSCRPVILTRRLETPSCSRRISKPMRPMSTKPSSWHPRNKSRASTLTMSVN